MLRPAHAQEHSVHVVDARRRPVGTLAPEDVLRVLLSTSLTAHRGGSGDASPFTALLTPCSLATPVPSPLPEAPPRCAGAVLCALQTNHAS